MKNNSNKTEYKITGKETVLGLVVIVFLSYLFFHGAFNNLESKMLDLRFQFREAVRTSTDNTEKLFKKEIFPKEKIIIIGLDDKTKDKIKTLPVPRNYYVMAIENLKRFGVRTMGFDMLFETKTKSNPEVDDEFAEILKKYHKNVVLGMQLTNKTVMGVKNQLPVSLFEKFDEPSTGVKNGVVNVGIQADSFCRVMPLVHTFNAESGENADNYPSLSTSLVANYLGLRDQLEKSFKTETYNSNEFKLGNIKLQTGKNKSALINYCGPSGTFKSIPLCDVFTISDLEKRIFHTTLDLKNRKLHVEDEKRDPFVKLKEIQCGKGSISGMVNNFSGLDGEIIVYAYTPQSKLFGSSIVNKDGSFKIEGLTDGYYRVNAVYKKSVNGSLHTRSILGIMTSVLDGKETKGLSLWIPQGDKKLRTMLKMGEKIKDDTVFRAELDTLSYTAETDDKGLFTIKGLPSGPAKFSAYKMDEETYESIEMKEEIVNINSSDAPPFNILYSFKNNYIDGQIFNKDGSPVSDCDIIAYFPYPDTDPLLKFNVMFMTSSDENGNFKLGKIYGSGYYILSITEKGEKYNKSYIEEKGIWIKNSDIQNIEEDEEEIVENYLKTENVLKSSGEISGKIIDAFGKPVSGVTVAVDYFKSESSIITSAGKLKENNGVIEELLPGTYNFYGERSTSDENRETSRELKCTSFNFEEADEFLLVETAENILNTLRNDEYISGKIKDYNKKEGETELFLVDDSGLVIAKEKPDDKGNFKFAGINSGKYNIISEKKDSKNNVFMRGIATLTGIDLKDTIVIFGSLLKTAEDFYPTPFNFDPFGLNKDGIDKMYGVEIHANTVHMLLNNNGIIRIKKIYNFMIFLFLTIIVMIWMQKNNFKGGFIRVSLISCVFIFGNIYAFIKYNTWIDLFMPLLGISLVFLFSVSYKYHIEQKRKKEITGIFEKMVPKSVVDQCLENSEAAQVNGKKEYLTILFSDIRGFTPMSEALTPEEVVEILNEYMGEMTKIIFNNKGTLDKFIGDAIMVIFGAPVPYDDHPYYAVKCAIEMRDKLNELRKKWGAEGKRMINVGIGVNTGDVVVGNMGSEDRMNYTVIGDHVNLAARLEANTKGGQILISGDTFAHIKDKLIYEKPDPIKVKGKSMLIPIYDVINVKEKVMGEAVPVEEKTETDEAS